MAAPHRDLARLTVLKAIGEGRVMFVPTSPQCSKAIMKATVGRRKVDVTITANWLRSHKLADLPYRREATGRVARPLRLTKAGQEALDIAIATGQIGSP